MRHRPWLHTGLADGPQRPSLQALLLLGGDHPLYDPLLGQVSGMAEYVQDPPRRRRSRFYRGPHDECGHIHGADRSHSVSHRLRPSGDHHCADAPLLRIYISAGVRGTELHQLRAGGDGRDPGSQQAPDPAEDHPASGAARYAFRRDPDLLQGHRHLRHHQLSGLSRQLPDAVQRAVFQQ